MEIFTTIQEVLDKYPNSYVSHAQMGNCMVCGKNNDLRAGACFECCDKVSGEKIKGGHRLWETANPSNIWYCGD